MVDGFALYPDILIDLEDFGKGRAFSSYILLMPPSNMHLTNELMMHHRQVWLHLGINGKLIFVSFFAINHDVVYWFICMLLLHMFLFALCISPIIVNFTLTRAFAFFLPRENKLCEH